MNMLDVGVSKLGRWNKRIRSLSMLLQLDEVPSKGWNLVFEHAWRMGESPGRPLETKSEYEDRRAHESAQAVRAREAGGFVGYRVARLTNPFREITTQVMPYASSEDAAASVPKAIESSRNRPSDQITLIEERAIEHEGSREASTTFIERDQLHKDVPCKVRMVIGTVDNIVWLVGCSEHGEAWTWNEVNDIAFRQAEKIRRICRRISGPSSSE